MQASRSRRGPGVHPRLGTIRSAGLWLPWMVLLAVVLGAGGCVGTSPRGRTSYMSKTPDSPPPSRTPVGLNPLGALSTCDPGKSSLPGDLGRVLVSRPEHFSKEASLMILDLKDNLAQLTRRRKAAVEMMLTPEVVHNQRQAVLVGRVCEAMIVLWEKPGTRTLELTLPRPLQNPLRDRIRENMCEFGSQEEQLNILFHVIASLSALKARQVREARYFMEQAEALDTRCFHLPE